MTRVQGNRLTSYSSNHGTTLQPPGSIALSPPQLVISVAHLLQLKLNTKGVVTVCSCEYKSHAVLTALSACTWGGEADDNTLRTSLSLITVKKDTENIGSENG